LIKAGYLILRYVFLVKVFRFLKELESIPTTVFILVFTDFESAGSKLQVNCRDLIL